MATSGNPLYWASESAVDYDLVRRFVLDAEAASLFTESLTFEAKEKVSGSNVVEAVAALSNTDGGIVLVGVKDKGAAGEARIVGVPPRDHDMLVSQMQSLIPGAMPQVIPVAVPEGRLVLVLRVDADAVLHPVMVGGRVLYRIPGQKAPADRQRVIELIARDSQGQQQSGPMQMVPRAWQPREYPLWPDENGPAAGQPVAGTLRVVGGLTLPSRILDRPWLRTEAKQAAADVLDNSPLRHSPVWSLQPWILTDARSGSADYRAAISPGAPVHAEGGACLRLNGRYLALLAGFRWLKDDDGPFRLSIETFYEALQACMITIASTCAHVSMALNAAEPTQPRAWEAWLNSYDQDVFHVLDADRFVRHNKDTPAGAWFPPTTVAANDLPGIEQTARDWLTYWLLDIGTRGFEHWLETKTRPGWLCWPDLAARILYIYIYILADTIGPHEIHPQRPLAASVEARSTTCSARTLTQHQ